jgi:methylenetetrahydrofolate reductase (NADPH)
VELIRALKTALPGCRVYAAVDPYRASFRAEMEHAAAKVDAGADGFFTQPFFDLRLMDVWAEVLAGLRRVGSGGCALAVDRPDDADTTEEEHVVDRRGPDRALGPIRPPRAQVLSHHRRRRVYYMPIAGSIAAYLEGIA